jgi:membrane protein YqaA with SNARE-associated domain
MASKEMKDRKGKPSAILVQEKGKKIRPKEIQLAGIDKKYGAVAGTTSEKTTNAGGGTARRKSDAVNRVLEASKEEDDDNDDDDEVTYTQLLKRNRPFRLFMCSYIANSMGEWLTYLASISAIEKIQLDSGIQETSSTAISALIIVRLTPTILLIPFGGVLADGRDRRETMIILDIIGAVVAWLFILALELQSIPMILLASFLQSCVAGLYEPSRSAIVPLLVPEDEGLKQATTLSGVAYALVATFGSASGGLFVSLFGIRTCYSKFTEKEVYALFLDFDFRLWRSRISHRRPLPLFFSYRQCDLLVECLNNDANWWQVECGIW